MAKTRTYRTRGIVLHKTKLSEQDLILTLLSDDGCQRQVVAKGARKPQGRLAARCDLFCEVDFLLAHGRSLDIVSEAFLIDSHQSLRADIERMSAASCLCQMAQTSSYSDACDKFLYPLLRRAIQAIEQASSTDLLDVMIAAYVFKVLAHAGWRPQLDECISCGDAVVSRFSALLGGVVCESCASEHEGCEEISTGEISWIKALLNLTFDELLAAQVDTNTANFLVCTAHIWASTHLECRFKAFEYYLSL